MNHTYLDVGQFKIPLRKDTDCRTIHYYLDLKLTPRSNYQTEAAFPTRLISGYTIPTGTALASRLLMSGARGVVAPFATVVRPFIAISMAAQGLPALHTIASTQSAHLISGGAMGMASVFTVITYFAASMTTPGLPTFTTTTTPAMRATAMVAVEMNIWHYCLGHPNERAMQAARNIAEAEVIFSDSLTACDICKINKGIKQSIRNEPGTTEFTERRLQPLSLRSRDVHDAWELPLHGQELRPLH